MRHEIEWMKNELEQKWYVNCLVPRLLFYQLRVYIFWYINKPKISEHLTMWGYCHGSYNVGWGLFLRWTETGWIV